MTADPGVDGAPRTEVVLPAVPALGPLYARGVAASALLAARSRLGRASADLPDVTVVARDVRADADRLTAYQHLLGETATDTLPAGFVHVLAFPVATALMVRPDFPLPLAGLVHLANRVEQHRPVSLGEPVEVRAHARDLHPHRSGTRVDLVTQVRAGGEVVWHGASTYLARGVRLATGPAGGEDDTPRAGFVPPTPTGRWVLGGDVGRRYAAVSGDVNPIHLSRVTARPLGFRRAIAHGMYTAARALATVGPARGDAFTWTVRFATPVLLPGTVAVRVAPDGDGFGYAGWDERSGALHLAGDVRPR